VTTSAEVVELATPVGLGRVHVTRPRAARGVLALGHGAGPSITTVDLVAAVESAVGAGWAVALVEQPWLVAGGRVAPRPPVLDSAWVPLVAALRGRGGPLARVRGPLVVGGRSAGARVACRTAGVVGAGAVLCLSFPLHAPGKPHVSRADELGVPLGAGLPVHVVQGERDPFGGPAEVLAAQPALAGRVHPVPGTHTIARAGGPLVAEAVRLALADLLFWE